MSASDGAQGRTVELERADESTAKPRALPAITTAVTTAAIAQRSRRRRGLAIGALAAPSPGSTSSADVGTASVVGSSWLTGSGMIPGSVGPAGPNGSVIVNPLS